MLSMASLNMSLLKINMMSLWVASPSVQGRMFFFTVTDPLPTASTWNIDKTINDSAFGKLFAGIKAICYVQN